MCERERETKRQRDGETGREREIRKRVTEKNKVWVKEKLLI